MDVPRAIVVSVVCLLVALPPTALADAPPEPGSPDPVRGAVDAVERALASHAALTATEGDASLPSAQLQALQEARHILGKLQDAAVPLASGDPFERAEALLELRSSLASGEVASRLAPAVAAQVKNLEAAHELSTLLKDVPTDPVTGAVEAAQAVTLWQAQYHGFALEAPGVGVVHAIPSEAVLALIERSGGSVTPEQEASILALDELPAPVRDVLTRFVDSFIRFQSAAEAGYGNADLDKLHAALGVSDVTTAGALAAAGIDVGSVLVARNDFLASALDLHDAIDEPGVMAVMAASAPSPVNVAPYVGIDLTGGDQTYLENYHLLLDVGGSDTYLNNAGGNGIGDCNLSIFAAALVDIGNPLEVESDYYNVRRNNDWRGDSCGHNGGANGPVAGFLLDIGGSDHYGGTGNNPVPNFREGVNGGATGGGLGFLLDTDGDDTYNAGSGGVNGGGDFAGIGFLLDGLGSDVYAGTTNGVNGGGSTAGIGILIDVGNATDWAESDLMKADGFGTNGGGYAQGSGLLVDVAGYNSYEAGSFGTNGGAEFAGHGMLLDLGLFGGDTYTAGSQGTNGGGSFAGVGFLYDQGGWETYSAGSYGTNGGGGGTGLLTGGGYGFLLDAEGGDQYRTNAGWSTGSVGVNGGGANLGVGFLIDLGGSDQYTAGDTGANGGAANGGIGSLFDLSNGDDSYTAQDTGTNGGGYAAGSAGFLLDAGGSWQETFTATNHGTNGGGDLAGVGFLVHLFAATTTYTATSFGTNGGGSAQGSGFLYDVGLGTTYQAGSFGTNGGGDLGGRGVAIDVGCGNDVYNAGGFGTNGGGSAGGIGVLVNDCGNDDYTGTTHPTNGGGDLGGIGLLVDGLGADDYDETTAAWDCPFWMNPCTVLSKGSFGTRIDT